MVELPRRESRIDHRHLLAPLDQLMRRDVGTVTPDQSVESAVGAMVEGHWGCVLVVENSELVGILSERDVLTKVAHRGLDPKSERVRAHMTRNPECLRPEDAVAYALNIMAVGGFRHVPITDEAGRLEGIVSIRDILRLVVESFREEIMTLPPDPLRRGPDRQHGG
jgi:CBS domain-containing protein